MLHKDNNFSLFFIIQVLRYISKKTVVSWICSSLIIVELSVVICSVNQYFANKDQDNNQMLIDIDKNLTIFESGDEIILFIHVDYKITFLSSFKLLIASNFRKTYA